MNTSPRLEWESYFMATVVQIVGNIAVWKAAFSVISFSTIRSSEMLLLPAFPYLLQLSLGATAPPSAWTSRASMTVPMAMCREIPARFAGSILSLSSARLPAPFPTERLTYSLVSMPCRQMTGRIPISSVGMNKPTLLNGFSNHVGEAPFGCIVLQPLLELWRTCPVSVA